MKSVLTKADVIQINQGFGGTLRSDSSLDFAFTASKDKTERQKLALLWRAILVDHPFDDGNKRTVELITRHYAKKNQYTLNTERLVKEIIEVSKNSITTLQTIERRIKYATRGN